MEIYETKAVQRLWKVIPPRRKKQLFGIFILLLAGAFAEIATIGAVLPFLQIVTNPQNVAHLPLVGRLLAHSEPHELVFATAAALIILAAISRVVRLRLLWVLQEYSQGLAHEFGTEIFRRSIRQPYSQFVR